MLMWTNVYRLPFLKFTYVRAFLETSRSGVSRTSAYETSKRTSFTFGPTLSKKLGTSRYKNGYVELLHGVQFATWEKIDAQGTRRVTCQAGR